MELIINLEVDGAFKTNKIERDIDGIFEASPPEKEDDELNEAFKKRIQNTKINKKGLTLEEAKSEKLRLDRFPWTVPKEDLEKEKEKVNSIINELEEEERKKDYLKKIDNLRVDNKLILFNPGMIYDSNLGRSGNQGSKIYIDYRFSIQKMKLPKSVRKITTDIQEIVTNANLFQKVTEYNLKKLGKENRKNYLYININFLVKLFLKKKTKILLNGTIYEILENPINLDIKFIEDDVYTIEKILVIKESDSTPANIKKLKKQLKNKENKKNCKDKRVQINNNSQQLFGIDIFDNESSDDEEDEETILDNDNLYLGPLHGKFNKGGKKKIKKKTKRKPKIKRKNKAKTKKLN